MERLAVILFYYFPVSAFVGSDAADDALRLKFLQMPFNTFSRNFSQCCQFFTGYCGIIFNMFNSF